MKIRTRIAGESWLTARVAGVLYFAALLTAASGEIFLRGELNVAAGLIAVVLMATVTLLFYAVFKSVSRRLSLFAVFCSLVGLTFEALRLNPRGIDVALVFHGFYCLGIGYLIFHSRFLPRFSAVLMAIAGCAWLTFLLSGLSNALSPYNQAAGVIGEAVAMLWFMVKGVSARAWKVPSSAVGVWR
jgi:hypothetical protein